MPSDLFAEHIMNVLAYIARASTVTAVWLQILSSSHDLNCGYM